MVGAAALGAMAVRQASVDAQGPYIAPMGWQVLAGLMVKALRSVTSIGVCLSNMEFPLVVRFS